MQTAEAGAAIVALCDVADPHRTELGRRKKKGKGSDTILDHFPEARLFTDYREMIDTMPGIDAVTVSTPDHHHFGNHTWSNSSYDRLVALEAGGAKCRSLDGLDRHS